jgi:hypothetical protein
MIDAEKNLSLREVHNERRYVRLPALELLVLALMEVVNSDVDFGTAGHPARQLLAEEKIRMATERL